MKNLVISISFMLMITNVSFSQNDDPFLWLEDVDNQKSLDWVNQKNEYSLGVLKGQKTTRHYTIKTSKFTIQPIALPTLPFTAISFTISGRTKPTRAVSGAAPQ